MGSSRVCDKYLLSMQTFLNRSVADTFFGPSHEEVRRTVAGAFDKRSVEGEDSDTVGICSCFST